MEGKTRRRRAVLRVAASGAVLAAAAWGVSELASSSPPGERATVLRVIDGDTLETSAGRVRLLGIDTPEVYGGVECGGPEASARMKVLLPAETSVRLVRDSGEPDKDRYGRLLRYVQHDGDVGRRLVREGRAVVYEGFPTSRTPSYERAQAQAKRGHLGVWGECS